MVNCCRIDNRACAALYAVGRCWKVPSVARLGHPPRVVDRTQGTCRPGRTPRSVLPPGVPALGAREPHSDYRSLEAPRHAAEGLRHCGCRGSSRGTSCGPCRPLSLPSEEDGRERCRQIKGLVADRNTATRQLAGGEIWRAASSGLESRSPALCSLVSSRHSLSTFPLRLPEEWPSHGS